jgi:DNA-binding IscR family transcriptional regulator
MKRRYLFLRARKQGMGGFGESVMVSDVRWVLALAVMVCRRFKQGKTTGVEEAAEALMLPNDVTGAMLTAMERDGLLLCSAEAGNHYTLARPAENITAYDLLNSMRSVSEVPAELVKERATHEGASAAMREFEELETNWAKKKTLAELAS